MEKTKYIENAKVDADFEPVEEAKTPSLGKSFDPNFGKTKSTVYRNDGEELFLLDEKGNGFKIPTPSKYKDAKKGDIVYI